MFTYLTVCIQALSFGEGSGEAAFWIYIGLQYSSIIIFDAPSSVP